MPGFTSLLSSTGPARLLAALALTLAVVTGATEPAFAHAALIEAEPAEGDVLAVPPERFSLTFNEPVSPLVLRLVRADGTAIRLGRYALHATRLDIEAPPELRTGTQVLSWRVISEDGHPVGGSVVFSIGAPSRSPPPVLADTVEAPVRAAIWVARVALYVGLFLGVGGAFFMSWVARRSRRGVRFAGGTLILGLLAVPLSLGVQGLDAQDLPMARLARGAVWRTGLGTSYGITAAVAFLALLLGLLSLGSRRPRIGKALSLVALLGVGAALASSGHASAASPEWLTRPAVFLHGAGIAAWAGSLVPLGLLVGARDAVAVPALERSSRAMPFVLAPLIAAGITLAAIQIETPAALVTTAYGRVFLVKMALVLTLLALAAFNRWRLTAPVLQGHEVAARRLGRMIGLEAVLVLAILGTAALWRFTPPPRALLEAAAAPAEVHIHGGKAMADVRVTPGRAGPVTASIFVATGDFQPLEAKEVTLELANPGAGIEPIKRTASGQGDGSWRVQSLRVPVAGRWSARIDILVSDFDLVTLEEGIVIRP